MSKATLQWDFTILTNEESRVRQGGPEKGLSI